MSSRPAGTRCSGRWPIRRAPCSAGRSGCSAWPAPPVPAKLGYWAHPHARGQGLTARAVRLVARHGLLPDVGGLGLNRLVIRAAADNVASQRVAVKAGFRPAGRDRCAERLRDGTLADLLRFELVTSDLVTSDLVTSDLVTSDRDSPNRDSPNRTRRHAATDRTLSPTPSGPPVSYAAGNDSR